MIQYFDTFDAMYNALTAGKNGITISQVEETYSDIPDRSLDYVCFNCPFRLEIVTSTFDFNVSRFYERILPKLKPDAVVFGSFFYNDFVKEGVAYLLEALDVHPIAFTASDRDNTSGWALQLGKKEMVIKVIQHGIGDNPLYHLSEKINRAYCAANHYAYIRQSEMLPHQRKQERAPHWEKVPLMLHALHDCDYLFYLDMDAVFVNHAIRIEPITYYIPSDTLIYGVDDYLTNQRGRIFEEINTGSVFIRNTPKTVELLQRWNNLTESDPHWAQKWNFEQSALTEMKTSYPVEIGMNREYYLHSGTRGHFIRHFMGSSNPHKYEYAYCIAKQLGIPTE